MFHKSHCFVAMPVTSQKYMFQFIPIKLVNGDGIVRACDRHSNETVTLGKHVTKYKNMQKWMVEFLRKFENRCIKIAWVNSSYHKIYQFSYLHKFCMVLGVHCNVDILKLTANAQSINKDVYGIINKITVRKKMHVEHVNCGLAVCNRHIWKMF